MIPAGSTPIDTTGIAELYGMTASQARRARPWARSGHPPPLTSGRAAHGKPQLWDRAQAVAYAAGTPIPPLPEREDSADLLDRKEAAALAGVAEEAWRRDRYRGRVPPADAEPYGIPHWTRATVLGYREQRATPRQGPHPGGRPAGSPPRRPGGQVRQQVAALLEAAHDSGQPITTAEIARRIGVHYTTAHQHRRALER